MQQQQQTQGQQHQDQQQQLRGVPAALGQTWSQMQEQYRANVNAPMLAQQSSAAHQQQVRYESKVLEEPFSHRNHLLPLPYKIICLIPILLHFPPLWRLRLPSTTC